VTPESSRIEDLRIEARYRRERYDLYRAKMYGRRPTTLARLRELERPTKAPTPASVAPSRKS
jgi:hypothetical protein